MSESENEPEIGISDDALPDDLVPSDDNPLAEGLEDGETVEGLMTEGKDADDSKDQDANGDTTRTRTSQTGHRMATTARPDV